MSQRLNQTLRQRRELPTFMRSTRVSLPLMAYSERMSIEYAHALRFASLQDVT